VLQARSYDVVSAHGIHYRTLDTYSPDNKVFYILSDIQTRLRVKIQLIVREYYLNREKLNKIDTYGLTTDIDGEKIFKNIGTSYDRIADEMCNCALNVNRFIDHSLLDVTARMNTGVKSDMIRSLLVKFSNMATIQYGKNDHDKLSKDGKLYEGYRILVQEFVQKTYRACALAKINATSKLAILEYVQHAYRSSRINDQDVLKIKDSIEAFVIKNSGVTREATISALKIAFVTYLILLSFKCM